jgi:hypothetical protein
MIRLFTGFDQREAAGWHAFTQSLIDRASHPVAVTTLSQAQQRDGSNAFTYARFHVPALCEYEGFAVFADGADMILLGDLSELWDMADPSTALQVVKHDYRTKHARKYRGTAMECDNRDYARKNWSSLILWNCSHPANRILTPEFIAESSGEFLHRFGWLSDEQIGSLPSEWNWLADEFGKNERAKLLHYTAGIPAIPDHARTAHAQAWFVANARSMEVPEEAKIRRLFMERVA